MDLRPIIVSLAVGALVGLVGFAVLSATQVALQAEDNPVNHHTFQTRLPDGGTATCVAYKDGNRGGLSCDWEHIKP
jgi:hypothetical protein